MAPRCVCGHIYGQHVDPGYTDGRYPCDWCPGDDYTPTPEPRCFVGPDVDTAYRGDLRGAAIEHRWTMNVRFYPEPAVDPDAHADLLLSHVIADVQELRERVNEHDRKLSDTSFALRHQLALIKTANNPPAAEPDRLAADHDRLVELVRELWDDILSTAERQWHERAEAGDPLAALLLALVTDETP